MSTRVHLMLVICPQGQSETVFQIRSQLLQCCVVVHFKKFAVSLLAVEGQGTRSGTEFLADCSLQFVEFDRATEPQGTCRAVVDLYCHLLLLVCVCVCVCVHDMSE